MHRRIRKGSLYHVEILKISLKLRYIFFVVLLAEEGKTLGRTKNVSRKMWWESGVLTHLAEVCHSLLGVRWLGHTWWSVQGSPCQSKPELCLSLWLPGACKPQATSCCRPDRREQASPADGTTAVITSHVNTEYEQCVSSLRARFKYPCIAQCRVTLKKGCLFYK